METEVRMLRSSSTWAIVGMNSSLVWHGLCQIFVSSDNAEGLKTSPTAPFSWHKYGFPQAATRGGPDSGVEEPSVQPQMNDPLRIGQGAPAPRKISCRNGRGQGCQVESPSIIRKNS